MSVTVKAVHTPGPWEYEFDADGDHVILTEGGQIIAVTSGNEYMELPTDAANARLMAAAPEMLEALEELWPFIHEDGMESSELSSFKRAWLKAEAVIHKAREGPR